MNKFLLGVSFVLSSLVAFSTSDASKKNDSCRSKKIGLPKFGNEGRMPLKKQNIFAPVHSRDIVILCDALISKGK